MRASATKAGERAVTALIEALRKAEDKHPGWPDDPMEQLVIIMEEIGEASEAALVRRYGHDDGGKHYRHELLDAGAVILRALIWCEQGGAR